MQQLFVLGSDVLGAGPVLFQWQRGAGSLLAVAGEGRRAVQLLDRNGKGIADPLPLTAGKCAGLEWSPGGESLAVLQEGCGTITAWSAHTHSTTLLETGWKSGGSGGSGGPALCRWSRDGLTLAVVAAGKGNVVFFQMAHGRKVPQIGKHSKAIVDAQWLGRGATELFVAISLDRTMSVSSADGTTVSQVSLGQEPSIMRLSGGDNARAAVVLDKRVLRLLAVTDSSVAPIELSFSSKYGNICQCEWLAADRVVVGFASGTVIVVSVAGDNLGHELWSLVDFKDQLSGLAVSTALGKVATCGDSAIKIREMSDMQDIFAIVNMDEERGSLQHIAWSHDGTYLTVSSKRGTLYTFLCRLPQCAAMHGTLAVHMPAMNELALVDFEEQLMNGAQTGGTFPLSTLPAQTDEEQHCKIAVNAEPLHVSVSPRYVAILSAQSCQVYSTDNGSALVAEKKYSTPPKQVAVNSFHVAAMFDGTVTLQRIDDEDNEGVNRPTLSGKPVAMVLTEDFLIVATTAGVISHFVLPELGLACEYKHDCAVKNMFSNAVGTRIVFSDATSRSRLWNPIDEKLSPAFTDVAELATALWDSKPASHREVLALCDANNTLHEYVHFVDAEQEAMQLLKTGQTRMSGAAKAVALIDGKVVFYTATGKFLAVCLPSHNVALRDQLTPTQLLKHWYNLGQLNTLWQCVNKMDEPAALRDLAAYALEHCDVAVAMRAYRRLHDTRMILCLQDLDQISDRHLLRGKIAVLLDDFGRAQEHFLMSAEPVNALQLRRDLLQWDQALTLASKVAPREMASIALSYAQQLESSKKLTESLEMYRKCLVEADAVIKLSQNVSDSVKNKFKELLISGQAGYARATLRLGDIPRGMKLLQTLKDKKVLFECACILDELKQQSEAALMFEKAGAYEKAAELYIKMKSYVKVGELLPYFKSPRIHMQYAKAKEAEGQYEDAAQGYERAGDMDNLCRIYINYLKRIDLAVQIVRKNKSKECAKMIAKFFQTVKDYKAVVEFCIIADMRDEGFMYAKTYDLVEYYAELVADGSNVDELKNLAYYFEQHEQFAQAGKCLLRIGDYASAFRLLFLAPRSDDKAIELAIEAASKAKSEALTARLMAHLSGESDGIPKDLRLVLKAYLALGRYSEAARCAEAIATEDQNQGNYRQAHDTLLGCVRQFMQAAVAVPPTLEQMLMLLHSYVLIKVLIRMDDHDGGAKMLIRVSNCISKFPAHTVPILTSAVIECHKAGMKRSAYDYAAILCRPEYRSQIDAKYKKKIELIVRRPELEQPADVQTPCPFCSALVPEQELECSSCKNSLPYCIASGMHMELDDWCTCPSCHMPALARKFRSVIQKLERCPMCDSVVALDTIQNSRPDVANIKRQVTRETKDDEEGGPIVQGQAAAAPSSDSLTTSQTTLSRFKATAPIAGL